MNRTVLITGGLGYLGLHLAQRLSEENYRVVIIDNDSTSINAHIPARYKVYIADLKSDKVIQDIFAKERPFRVYHMASLKSIKQSLLDPITYHENNIGGTQNLITAMNMNGCKDIVFSSSATVYANDCKLPLYETSNVNPETPYGQNKREIELMLMKQEATNEWNVLILRYFNPIGWTTDLITHKRWLSCKLSGPDRQSMDDLFTNIIRSVVTNEPFKLYNKQFEDPNCPIRDLIRVDDLIDAHLLDITGIYNVGSGVGVSIPRVIHIAGCKYITDDCRDGDLPEYYASIDLIKSHWKPKHDIMSICENIVDVISQYRDEKSPRLRF
ncbi:MAG: NAD-dependent epimerase/dehydratase family protein [Bacteroidetes bacterium]|nr:NAD-dependent epimerase/dehydratase family protein [Bacteroidota bacterium]